MAKDSHKDKDDLLEERSYASGHDKKDISLQNEAFNLQLDYNIKEFGISFRTSTEVDDTYNMYERINEALMDSSRHVQDHYQWKAFDIHAEPCHRCYIAWERDYWRREISRIKRLNEIPWIQRFIDWCSKMDPSSVENNQTWYDY